MKDKVTAIYICWEGRGYAPECFYHDLLGSIQILGTEGPFFRMHTECGVIFATEANPALIHSHDLVRGADHPGEPGKLEDYAEEGMEFELYETWHELMEDSLQEDESEEDYWIAGNEALVQAGQQYIQIMSIDDGSYDMNKGYTIEEAIAAIDSGEHIEVYLGQDFACTPLIGLVFENRQYTGSGLDVVESLRPRMKNLAERLILTGSYYNPEPLSRPKAYLESDCRPATIHTSCMGTDNWKGDPENFFLAAFKQGYNHYVIDDVSEADVGLVVVTLYHDLGGEVTFDQAIYAHCNDYKEMCEGVRGLWAKE